MQMIFRIELPFYFWGRWWFKTSHFKRHGWLRGVWGKGQNVTSCRLTLRMGIRATLMGSLSGSLLLSTDWFLEEVDVR